MKTFCPNCGTKHEYQHAAPNFCSSCGNSLKSLSEAKSIEPEDLDEDESNVDHVPHLDKLQIEIAPANNMGQTLGDLLGTPTRPDKSTRGNRHDIDEKV